MGRRNVDTVGHARLDCKSSAKKRNIMNKKIIRNLSCIFVCFMAVLFFVPQTVAAQTVKPMFYNVHFDELGSDSDTWTKTVSSVYYRRCDQSVDKEPTRNLLNPGLQRLLVKMHGAYYVNIVAFGKDLNSSYGSELANKMLNQVRQLPKDYLKNVKMCYLGMGSFKLAKALMDKGVQCVIYGGAYGYQSQREMVTWFNQYFVLAGCDAGTALEIAKKQHEHDRGPHNAYRISSIRIIGNKMVKYNK